MSTYEYGTAILEPNGALWDFYPRHDGYPGGAKQATVSAERWNAENADSDSACVVVRRSVPVPAGEWEVVANPSARPALSVGKDET